MAIDVAQLKAGNRRALAKAITLVESTLGRHREQAQLLLDDVLPATGGSIRIGISGVPGVGKSTFIESFGLHLVAQGRKVAVLAVDPSSPVAGGSILGDKTRMEELSRHPQAFIRPSPSSGALGGVAQKTRESILLCEAAGFDVVLVETVGVGQSEYDVASMVDFFLVLMIPNAGDELQGIKKGIMELVDALVINKADGESVNLAQQSKRHYENALQLLRSEDFWRPRVLTCSALQNHNLGDIWDMILEYHAKAVELGDFQRKRQRQNVDWMKKLIHELLDQRLKQNPEIRQRLPQVTKLVAAGEMTPLNAARQVVDLL